MHQTQTQKLNNLQRQFSGSMSMRQRVSTVLLVALVVFAGLYVFFLASTTMHIAERKNVQDEIRMAHSRIADLEAEFFFHANALDLAHAQTLGFVEAKEVAFLERTPATPSVAFFVE